jgi:hypothetical protein
MFEAKGKWVADLGNGKYKNPILFSDYSDPDVIRVADGEYQGFYMVASSFTYFPGLPVLYSKDLVNWRIISYAVNSLPFERYNYPQHGCGVWAPAIRYYDGKFWVYFSTPDEGIFMANTQNPFDKWNDVVHVREAKGWIDPCPFWDDDGQAYLVRGVAKSRSGLKSMLFMHKMTADGTSLLDDGVRVFDGRINHPTIEGPKMYKPTFTIIQINKTTLMRSIYNRITLVHKYFMLIRTVNVLTSCSHLPASPYATGRCKNIVITISLIHLRAFNRRMIDTPVKDSHTIIQKACTIRCHFVHKKHTL